MSPSSLSLHRGIFCYLPVPRDGTVRGVVCQVRIVSSILGQEIDTWWSLPFLEKFNCFRGTHHPCLPQRKSLLRGCGRNTRAQSVVYHTSIRTRVPTPAPKGKHWVRWCLLVLRAGEAEAGGCLCVAGQSDSNERSGKGLPKLSSSVGTWI